MKKKKLLPVKWYVYMLECADGSIYTGITNDVKERVAKHNSGKGAKYTKARLPVVLKAKWKHKDKSEAAKAEYAFKQLTREEKLLSIKKQSRKRKGT
ncbi:MAG TPA: GIY-YIG nuclease family protein [Bacteroidia bacterium]|jgi:predicted GIY-YIG superfamily endonuclease|nr:GIY-YIG nuclease family protein [Bacteroidia bacterium]